MKAEHYLLYVDDDPDDLEMIGDTLASIDSAIGFRSYTNGKDAFAFLQSIPSGEVLPAVIILDLNMPGWDGWQTLQAIKENGDCKDIPVFIFTNSDYPGHQRDSLEKGAAGFLTKPYRQADLLKTCAIFLEYTHLPAQVK